MDKRKAPLEIVVDKVIETKKTFEPKNARASILYVEDDEMVAEITMSFLIDQGYVIYYARNAQEALEQLDYLQSFQLPLDLLVTDVMMPGISGIELVRKVRVKLPMLKVVVLTGYFDERPEGIDLDASRFRFLHKPLSKSRILSEIHHLLDDSIKRECFVG